MRVAAYSEGRGPYSDRIVNFTMEGGMQYARVVIHLLTYSSIVPRSGPLANITRLSDSSIAVSWEPLTLEEARGFATGYTVTAVPRTLPMLLLLLTLLSHNVKQLMSNVHALIIITP